MTPSAAVYPKSCGKMGDADIWDRPVMACSSASAGCPARRLASAHTACRIGQVAGSATGMACSISPAQRRASPAAPDSNSNDVPSASAQARCSGLWRSTEDACSARNSSQASPRVRLRASAWPRSAWMISNW